MNDNTEDRGKGLILVVDDDAKSLKLVRDLLQINGYKTIEASNGREGVVLASTEMPDLVLMDIHLPVMSGIDACGEIKQDPETGDIPVMALTASVLVEERQTLMQLGCFEEILSKPIDIEEFLDKVEELLTHRRDTTP